MFNKRSFFERLTGGASMENEEEEQEQEQSYNNNERNYSTNEVRVEQIAKKEKNGWLQEGEEGQLTVDMYQTPNEIIVQATIAGVRPEDLDISITRDMVTIKGKRQKIHSIVKEDYFYQELYWGSFARSILLPQEIDTETAEALIKNGMLTVKLPKIDKNRTQKIKVKAE